MIIHREARFKKWVEDNIKRFQNEGVTTEYAMPVLYS